LPPGSSSASIVLVRFPFTDQTAAKQRPAVVISSEAYHRARPDIVIMAITSQTRWRPAIGEAPIRRWQEAGLIKPSALKPLLATVERSLVRRKLGHLEPEHLQALRGLLPNILGG
jgi:mRNA interferase MazF